MIITRDNYQILVTDYFEGLLEPWKISLLMDFLEENPDLKAEFEDFNDYRLSPESLYFESKESLKKAPDELQKDQLDYYHIALLENDLGEKQSEEILDIIKSDTSIENEFNIYRKIKLSPEENYYPDKNKLKRIPYRKRRRNLARAALSMAASIIILLGLLISFNQKQPETYKYTQSEVLIPKEIIETSINAGNINFSSAVKKNSVGIKKGSDAFILFADREVSPVIESNTLNREEIIVSPANFSGEIHLIQAGQAHALARAEPYAVLEPFDIDGNNNVRNFLTVQFREKVLREENPVPEKVSAFEIADAGIRGVNRLLGWDMKLEKEVSGDGEPDHLKFTSQYLKIDRKPKNTVGEL